MSTEFETLSWDSEHFGYKVASINFEGTSGQEFSDLLRSMSSQGVKLAYWFTDPLNKVLGDIATENGGVLVDEKVTYVRDLPGSEISKGSSRIESYFGREINSVLERLALEAGVFSRYKIDSNFKGNEFKRLYTEWITNSLSGAIARDVLVYTRGGKILGFVTLGEKGSSANIGLIAVDATSRSQGVGRALVNAVSDRARQLGYKKLSVVTQKANVDACRFYERNGFKEDSVVNIYHFWI